MQLKKYRVTNFRSVEDSGWIEADEVTALIGTNESGKSNLLLPLWKLNPAKDGEISDTADFPRKHFGTIRGKKTKPVFVEAVFEADAPLREKLAKATKLHADELKEITVRRRLDGGHEFDFGEVPQERAMPTSDLKQTLEAGRKEIDLMEPLDGEDALKKAILDAVEAAMAALPEEPQINAAGCQVVRRALEKAKPKDGEAEETSSIVPRYLRLTAAVSKEHGVLAAPHPRDIKEVKELILNALPSFVYYSNYGNLDSEIYLPHVIQNLQREDLGQKELAKARTLKVLFEFVRLKPEEILELGKDLHAKGQEPTDEQIEAAAEKKKQRSILLQSASARLTQEFRKWWKQGDYTFRFEADGDHFRIWVSDDRRPEEVELEGRSTGLQWFLSFYLVFLVESQDTHSGCILLLDEPGHSLHPLAQRDLSEFFDGLAERNQLIYTTHSPFLVDADRLDRARKVFVDKDGTSRATADLGADGGDPTRRGAGYAVHAALGLSVAEGLLIGCQPVVVEGPSDQHYLTAIKTLLIAGGSLSPYKELVFPPAGGAKGIKVISSILGAREGELPVALLDSDQAGKQFASQLRNDLYADQKDRVLEVGDFIDIEKAEVEDLIPSHLIVKAVDRMIRQPEQGFEESFESGKAIVPQIEAWAQDGGAELEKGWKVELAKRVKKSLLGGAEIDDESRERWLKLFSQFQRDD